MARSRDRDDDDDRGRRDDRSSSDGGGYQYRSRSASDVNKRATQSTGNFDSIFNQQIPNWRAKAGENEFRICPPTWKDVKKWGPHYGIDIVVHRNVGPDNQQYLCPREMLGEDCAICDERRKMERNGADAEELKETKPGKSVLMYIIDRNAESVGPQLYQASITMDKDIASRSMDKKTKAVLAIDNPDEGYDVSFTREGTKLNTRYLGIDVARRPSPLCDDVKTEKKWMKFIIDNPLPELLKYYDYDYMKAAFAGGNSKRDRDLDPDDDDRSASKRSRSRDEDDDDKPRGRRSVRDEAEDDDDKPRGRRSSRDDDEDDRGSSRSRSSRDADDDDDRSTTRRRSSRDDDEDDKPRGGGRSSRNRDDDEDDKEPPRRGRSRDDDEDEPPKRSRSRDEDDDDKPRGRSSRDDDDDRGSRRSRSRDDDEDEPPKRGTGSRKRDDDDEPPKRSRTKTTAEDLDDDIPFEERDGKKAGSRARSDKGDEGKPAATKSSDDDDLTTRAKSSLADLKKRRGVK